MCLLSRRFRKLALRPDLTSFVSLPALFTLLFLVCATASLAQENHCASSMAIGEVVDIHGSHILAGALGEKAFG